MNPHPVFSQVETLYHQVLALTLRQESSLRVGDMEALPAIAQEQMEILGRAEAMMATLNDPETRTTPGFQEGVQRLATILAEVVASEERCKTFTPPHSASVQPPPGRVLAAYGRR